MKNCILFIICVTSIYSCCDKEEDLYYVIKPLECPDSTDCNLVFYGDYNFIIYNDSTIYYQKDSELGFGSCCIEDPSKPPFLDLSPNELIQVDDLESVIKNIKSSKANRKSLICVTSTSDTIRNPDYWKIKRQFIGNKSFLFGTSRATEEQLAVSDATFKNEPYNPYKIDWKIGFNDGGPFQAVSFEFLESIN